MIYLRYKKKEIHEALMYYFPPPNTKTARNEFLRLGRSMIFRFSILFSTPGCSSRIILSSRFSRCSYLPQTPVLMAVKVVFRLLDDHTVESDQSNHIRNRHETVKDISDGPYSGNCHVRSDKYRCDIDPAVNHNAPLASVGEIFEAAFAVVIPSENRRKGEE